MNKQIFLAFQCNRQKETPMELLFCTTSQHKMKRFLLAKIKDGTFSYSDMYEGTTEQIRRFLYDWEYCSQEEINANFMYGQFISVFDGEIIENKSKNEKENEE